MKDVLNFVKKFLLLLKLLKLLKLNFIDVNFKIDLGKGELSNIIVFFVFFRNIF